MLGLWVALVVSLGRVPGVAPPETSRLAGETITVAWDANDPSELVTGYRLLYGPTCEQLTQIVDVQNVTSYQLVADTPLCFRVQAYSAIVVSDLSEPVIFTPSTPPPPPPPPTVDPRCVLPFGDRAVSIFITRWEPTTGSPGSMARINFQLGSPNSPIVQIQVRLNGQPVDEPVSGSRTGGIWFTTPTAPGTYVVSLEATNAYGCSTVQGKNALGQILSFAVK